MGSIPTFKPNPAGTQVLGQPLTQQQASQPVPSGAAPITVDNFLPVFQSNVEQMAYGTGKWGEYDQLECLSENSAAQLLVLFGDLSPKIIHLPPNGPRFFGSFRGMENPAGVPWLVFPDGSFLNAGADIAQWWQHYPAPMANLMARGVIALNMKNAADHPEWKYDPSRDTGATNDTGSDPQPVPGV